MVHIILSVERFLEKMKEDRVGVYAAQASFFMILSVFPLIMLLLTIVKFSGLSESAVLELSEVIPSSMEPLYTSIVNELYAKATGTILSATAIAAIWSASKGVLSILRGLNEIYDVNEDKNYFYLRFLSLFYLLLFLAAFALVLILLVFGNHLYHLLALHLPWLANIVRVIMQNRGLIAFLVLIFLFTFMYRMVRNPNYRLKHCFPGAVFAATGWMLFSYVFSIYVDRSAGYSYMYGSLTGVILFMLWMYFCLNIFFIGAELTVHFRSIGKAK